MGYELVGVAGSLNGIHVDNLSASINYAVRNGTARNWGGAGVSLNIQGKHRVTDIRALNPLIYRGRPKIRTRRPAETTIPLLGGEGSLRLTAPGRRHCKHM